MPSASGNSNAGPRLKKSPPTRAHDRLHRRKRIGPTAASLPYLGSARRDTRTPISLQLEDHLGDGGHDAVEFLFSNLREGGCQGAGGGVPGELGATASLPGADRLGSPSGSPQPTGGRVRRPSAGPDCAGVPAGLRAGTQSRRISVGPLEAPRIAQRLRQALLTA